MLYKNAPRRAPLNLMAFSAALPVADTNATHNAVQMHCSWRGLLRDKRSLHLAGKTKLMGQRSAVT